MKNNILFASIFTALLILNACTNSSTTNNTVHSDSLAISIKDSLLRDSTQKATAMKDAEEGEDGNKDGTLSLKDSSITNYKDYYLKYIPYKEDGGGILTVLNKKTGKTIDFGNVEDGFQFYNDYIIYGDPTTTNMDNFEIATLATGEHVFGSECTESTFANGVMSFKAPVNDSLVTVKPTCSKDLQKTPLNIGYVELQKFDLKTLKLIQSGKFECYYAE
jgi:hypothetical protein